MKLERLVLVAIVVALSSTARTQNTAFRACLVNSMQVMQAHPQGKVAASLREAAQKELAPLAEQIKLLQAKVASGSATAAERQQLDALGKTYQATARKWQEKIDKAIAPVIKDVDAAVATMAQQQGCTMVFDSVAAGPTGTGLVIYANLKETDVTAEVIALIRK